MRSLARSGLLVLFLGCAATPDAYVDPRTKRDAVGKEILVAGERVFVGVPVVLWTESPRYSAYDTRPRFQQEGPRGLRYKPGRAQSSKPFDCAALKQSVDQLVIHYDACGLSRTCFRVLHDERTLSAHFLLDVDGTIYQTLDLVDTAWHARQANARSIGIEIANIGAYPPSQDSPLDQWYRQDADGLFLSIPERFGDGGLRDETISLRPARAQRIAGVANGIALEQVDFTTAQYESLAHLTAALVRSFPRLELRVPRDASGAVLNRRMEPEAEADFSGVLGHLHVSETKQDPGPAFNWEALLGRTGELLALGHD